MSSNVTVNVFILDQNDNAPVILYPVSSNGSAEGVEEVPRNVNAGHLVTKVRAYDADIGYNGWLLFTLQQVTDHSLFALDRYTGQIRTLRSFTETDEAEHKLVILVKDNGNVSLSATATVVVKVVEPKEAFAASDVKSAAKVDEDSDVTLYLMITLGSVSALFLISIIVLIAMQCSKSPDYTSKYLQDTNYDGTLCHSIQYRSGDKREQALADLRYSVPEEVKERTVVGNVAKDLGLDKSSLVDRRFRVVSGSKDAFFEVNPDNGALHVRKKIDREELCQGIDSGTPSLSSNVTVNVFILDQNDNAPVILYPVSSNGSAEGVEEVPRNVNAGHLVTKVRAYDADIGYNGWLLFTLQQVTDHSLFALDRYTGQIRTLRSFTETDEAEHKLVILVKDNGNVSLSATATVVVKVVEPKEAFAASDVKSAAKDAEDSDVTLYLMITLGSVSALFLISIIVLIAMQCSKSPDYTSKYLQDTNYDGTLCHSIQYRSGDKRYMLVGPRMSIGSTIVPGSHANTLVLPDRRTSTEFHVVATDSGTPSLSSNVTVNVFILDQNDNAPVILYPVSSNGSAEGVEEVPRNVNAGHLVTKVRAYDADIGYNGWLLFTLQQVTDHSLFALDRYTGQIRTLRSFTETDEAEHKLVILVKDNGNVSLSATATVVVKVVEPKEAFAASDVKSAAKDAEDSDVTLYLMITLGSVSALFLISIIVLIAMQCSKSPDYTSKYLQDTNYDGTLCHSIQYRSGDKRYMLVGPRMSIGSTIVPGSHANTLVLPDRRRTSEEFHVVATDSGTPSLSSNVTVNVFILDQNDNAPVILYPVSSNGSAEGVEEVPRNVNAGHLVTKVRAYDADIGYNGWLLFTLQQVTDHSLFALDRYTGQIRTLRSFTETDEAEHKLVILVKDNGNVSLSATATVVVKVVEPKEAFAASDVKSAAKDAEDSDVTLYLMITLGSVSALFLISIIVLIAMQCSKSPDYTSKYLQDTNYDGTLCHSIQYRSGDKRYMLVGPRMSIGSTIVPGSHANTLVLPDRKTSTEFQVVATDSGTPSLSSNVTVNVFILDQNDNAPVILYPVSSNGSTEGVEEVPRNVNAGHLVTKVRAYDADIGYNGWLLFTLQQVTDHSLFALDRYTGQIRTLRSFTETDEAEHKLVILVKDNGNVSLSATATVVVKVVEPKEAFAASDVKSAAKDAEDSDVTLYLMITLGSVSALFLISIVVLIAMQCSKSPDYTSKYLQDTNYDGTLCHSIQYRSGDKRYMLVGPRMSIGSTIVPGSHANTLVLPDRRRTSEEFHVVATDSGTPSLSSNVTVNVFILDQNDNAPVILYPVSSNGSAEGAEEVPRNVNAGHLVTKVRAYDADIGYNGWLLFTLQQVTDHSLFALDRYTGQIRTLRSFTETDEAEHKLVILVKDNGNVSLSATATVVVKVVEPKEAFAASDVKSLTKVDEEDNVAFYLMITLGSVSALFLISIIVLIAMQCSKSPDYTPKYLQDTNYDGTLCHSIQYRSGDKRFWTPSLSSNVTVNVFILDQNDNAPVILYPVSSNGSTEGVEEVPRNVNAGHLVTKVRAYDADIGYNGWLLFTLQQVTDHSLFALDRYTGQIRTLRSFTETDEAEHKLVILVKDNGNVSLSATATVVVKVVEPKEAFAASDVKSAAKDAEDSDVTLYLMITLGSVSALFLISIIVLIAMQCSKSPDYTSKYLQETNYDGTLCHSIQYRSGDKRYMLVGPRMSIGSTIVPGSHANTLVLPDRRRTSEEFQVVATDSGTPSLSSNVTVNVFILDQNDNAPVILYPVSSNGSAEGVEEVPRNVNAGHLVTKVRAYDADIGYNGWLLFTLQQVTDHSLFALDRYTGQIRTLRSFTETDEAEHKLVILVKDNGNVSLSATATVVVKVVEPKEAFAASDVKSAAKDAEDSDVTLYLMITLGSVSALFLISIIVLIAMQCSKSPDYTSKYLQDTNYDGTLCHSIQYRSGDKRYMLVGPRMSIGSTIVPGSHANTLVLPDRRRTSEEFQVVATDSGTPSLSSNVTVNVFILDQNDNAPVILYPVSSNGSAEGVEEVPRNVNAGHLVTKVRAYDADIGYNGWLLFTLQQVTDHSLFALDRYTGQIRTLRSFTETDEAEHKLVILVKDNGNVSLSATATVVVKVVEPKEAFAASDVKSAAKDDEDSDVTLYLMITLGSVSALFLISIIVLIAMQCSKSPDYTSKYLQDTNYDGTLCHSIQYRSGDKRYMLVGPRMSIGSTIVPGSHANTLVLPDRRRTSEEFHVVATDSGTPSLSSNVTVNVFILDQNDNAPVILYPVSSNGSAEGVEEVPRNVNAGHLVTKVRAYDADIGYNGWLLFTLQQVTDHSLFALDRYTGQIRTLRSFTETDEAEHKLVILVKDNGNVSLSATATVVVKVVEPKEAFAASDVKSAAKDSEDSDVTLYLMITLGSVSALFLISIIVLIAMQCSKSPDYTSKYLQDTNYDGTLCHSIQYRSGDKRYMLVGPRMSIGSTIVPGLIDYEQKDKYEIEIQASDKGLAPLTTEKSVVIKIVDVNDNAPEIEVTSFTSSIPEDSRPGTTVALISVNDLDSGLNGKVICSIAEDVPFALSPSLQDRMFALVTKSPLDREKQSHYDLTIVAKDAGQPPLSSEKTINVVVSDVNDNSPEFSLSPYTFYITEGNDPGASVFSVKASDRDENDNAHISYHIIRDGSEASTATSFLNINTDTGDITALKSFDFETLKTFQFHVVATDSGTPSLSSNVTVNVFILDQNDNAPVILYPVSSNGSAEGVEEVPRNVNAGHLVTKVRAYDADIGYNGWLLFTLQQVTDHSLFALDRYTGQIRTLRSFTETDEAEHKLVILVKDNGNVSLSATATVVVKVVEPKEAFAASDVKSAAKDDEDSDVTLYLMITLGSVSALFLISIIVLIAMQCSKSPDYTSKYLQDTNYDGTLCHSIQYRSGDKRYMLVGPRMSIGSTIVPGSHANTLVLPDRKLTPAEFHVVATDSGTPSLSSNVTVNVFILDQNDNAPVILYPVSSNGSAEGVEEVPRNVNAGHLVTKVRAYDADIGYNGWLLFTLQQVTDHSLFALDRYTGQIRTLRSFTETDEAEHKLVILFHVVATDSGTPSLSSNVTVNVFILDQNDNAPVILYPVSSNGSAEGVEEVPRNVNAGHLVTKVRAYDADIGYNGWLLFTLQQVTDHSLFALDRYTGQIRTLRSFTETDEAEHKLVILVKDNGNVSLSATATVIVKVVEPKEAFAASDVKSAAKDDEDSDVTLYLMITLGSVSALFLISIIVLIAMQCSKSPDYTSKYLQDTNYDGTLCHSIQYRSGDKRYMLVGPRMSIGSTIVPGSHANTLVLPDKRRPFEENDGILYVSRKIDKEEVCERTTTCIINLKTVLENPLEVHYVGVEVLDINDHSPSFPEKETTLEIFESVLPGVRIPLQPARDPDSGQYSIQQYKLSSNDHFRLEVKDKGEDGNDPGASVFSVKASDRDENDNAHISYHIIRDGSEASTATSFLNINTDTGDITALKSFDFETLKTFQFQVVATDSGTPSLSSNVTVNVFILDQNDNAPVILYPVSSNGSAEGVEEVPRNVNAGHLVTKVRAYDADIGYNGWLLFTLQQVTDHSLFALDRYTGQIRTLRSFTETDEAEHKLVILVKDNGNVSSQQQLLWLSKSWSLKRLLLLLMLKVQLKMLRTVTM
ncbi:hypothetical protein Q5P01_008982 [Channa striata]|uniref:Cadherin domain-containing protein n=1 Tax=Channa striata TaxID=64152 RepID=A0AA88N508_CHASR|nr:hypothetical protein Q5P01_008982 [Channa striata]